MNKNACYYTTLSTVKKQRSFIWIQAGEVMTLKIVIIGGGSSYTPEIMEGLIVRHDRFPVTDIVLVDIEEGREKLEIIYQLAIRMVKKAQKAITITMTTDRLEALKNADFIATQIRVGGLKARAIDEKIPLSHGVIGQETNGAGGIFKAFRTIPVLMEIAEDVHDICPDAWIINFTNPAGIITEVLLKHSPHKKIVGVCNIPFNMRHSTAEILRENPENVSIEFIGMNHFIFGKRVFVNGVDRTNEVLDGLLTKGMIYSPANIVSLGWSKAFINAIGMLPNPYHQYYFQTKDVLEKDLASYRKNGTRAELVQKLEKSLFELYKDTTLCDKPKQLDERGGSFYSNVACSLMDSIYNDKGDIQTVNILNNGAISDLPDDVVIEVNSYITKNGPKPIPIGPLPEAVGGLILHMKSFESSVIKASLSGNYNDAYTAMIMNPLIADEKLSKTLLDELIYAHQSYLPQFNLGG